MSLVRLAVCAAFSASLITAAADAQRAPVTRGVTSGDLAASTTELRQSIAEMQVDIRGLEAENAELNGKLETLEFLLGESRTEVNRMQEDDRQISNLISDLETRLAAQDAKIESLEARLNAPAAARTIVGSSGDAGSASDAAGSAQRTTSGLGTIPASALPGEAGPLFADAKSKLLRYDYAGAEASFRAFLDQFGEDAQAGEAQYWLGEVLYQQEAYAESGAAYTDMIQNYPDDPRAPDALVKLSRSLRLVGETDAACQALDQLPRRYPDASSVTRNLAAVERARSGC